MSPTPGKLYLVPTPVGNLSDITERVRETLELVDVVACEDTRVSGRLLSHLGLKKDLISYHDFNEASRAEKLGAMLREGRSIAVVSDAGSPGISDPAYRVVRTAIDMEAEIVPLPGPSALIPALTASGLPTDRFFFEGFLPHKSGARQNRLKALVDLEHTLVFYESPHRVVKSVGDMRDILGTRSACLAREISKKFEQFIRARLDDLYEEIAARPPKGEIVVIVAGAAYHKKESKPQE